MISVSEAWQIIQDTMPGWPVETLPIEQAYGRVLHEPVVADRDQPPFHRVTMDGIGIAFAEWSSGRQQFAIAGTHPAGAPAPTLPSPESCFEVMTGAVLPEGCDCVIPVEDIQVADGQATLLESADPALWKFVHRKGTDFPNGQTLLESGTLLRAPEIAVLAAVGKPRVTVSVWPLVTVVSTGDELVTPGEPVAAHQIRMSNDYAIQSALLGSGMAGCERLYLRDDPDQIRTELSRALERSQALILTGGVSKGKFDYLPEVLDELGVKKHFHRVRQRPGKPMWFGSTESGQPVFALPGNPVSALVGFHRYVLPAIQHAAGIVPHPQSVVLGETMSFSDHLAHFVPVSLQRIAGGPPEALPRELNTSGDFFSLAGTDGFVELAESSGPWKAGSTVHWFQW
ncbi:MAG: molybdopterin molybdotransferase MoeA [Xanthomonadales bacterium]|nr:molybdopterin molybdotransferase MoeA [Xanthomonadales bacterium]